MNQTKNFNYGAVAQAFHWATAIFVLVAFVYGLGGPEDRVYLSSRDFDRQVHETLGMVVLVLAVLRVLWKLVDSKPASLDLPRWMEISSKAVQGLLYLLLFAVPLTAVLGAWFEGHPVVLLAGVQFASPFAVSHKTGVWISEIHTWLGDAILWLAGAHAAAAIYHHAVLKDVTLVSMLPPWLAQRLPGRS
jgi:cytochrome b561